MNITLHPIDLIKMILRNMPWYGLIHTIHILQNVALEREDEIIGISNFYNNHINMLIGFYLFRRVGVLN